MKHIKLLLISILVLSMLAFFGCGEEKTETPGQNDTPVQSETPDPSESSDGEDDTNTSAYNYSEGIDDNGNWEGITALDHVELCEYKGVTVPADVHTIPDEEVDAQIDSILSSFNEEVQVTDRAVADGDTVNIDYVGSIDGVEFAGGNTNGMGTTVTIGVTSYIDDFLEQLIGHKPGETFDVEVTFPEPYPNNTDLSGKDAVFSTTINYIVETVAPEFTDSFVAEKLSEQYGWKTVSDVRDGVYADLQRSATITYIQQYLNENVTVKDIPDTVLDYVQGSMINYFQQYADQSNMDLETFITTYTEYESLDDVYEKNKEDNLKEAGYYMTLQAIAEKEGIVVDLSDIEEYFASMGVDDYSQFEERYGLPYLKQSMLFNKVMEFLADNAVLAD